MAVSASAMTEKLHLIRWRNVFREQLQAKQADDEVNSKAIDALKSQTVKNTELIRRLVAERDGYLVRLSEPEIPMPARVRLSRPIKNLEFTLRNLVRLYEAEFDIGAVAPIAVDSHESRLRDAENRIAARDSAISEVEAKYDECLRRINDCQEAIGAATDELARNADAIRDWDVVDLDIHNIREFLNRWTELETVYAALQAELREVTGRREREIAERNGRLDERLIIEYVGGAADRDALAEEREQWTLRVGHVVAKLTG
jgi:hypothetical protein